MRRKKNRIIRQILHKDCKACLRQRNMQEPLIKDMSQPMNTNVTLVRIKNSLPYLQKFTALSRKQLPSMFDENSKALSEALTDYFDDISNILEMVVRMKHMGGINP